MTIYITKYRPFADTAAISLSILCALHCLATPVALTLYPSAIALGLGDEIFHLWMLFGVVPFSVFALTLGCGEHRNLRVAGAGALGITLLCASAMLGHDLLGDWGERVLTLIGAGIVAGSHVRNFAICRQSQVCNCADFTDPTARGASGSSGP